MATRSIDGTGGAGRKGGLTEPYALLSRFAERARAGWPLPVAHPLDRLVTHLAGEQPIAAYFYLRGAAEGVLRVMWAVLLRDVLAFLSARPAGLGGLPAVQVRAFERVLAQFVEGEFYMGGVARQLAGVDAKARSAVAVIAAALPEGLTTSIARVLANPKVGEKLRALADWRNADPGHGTLGREERIEELLRGENGKVKPVADLAGVLEAAAEWFEEAQRELPRWPGLDDARAWRRREENEGVPEPMAYSGVAPLLLTERFDTEHGRLQLRDVLGGERSNRPYRLDTVSRALAERLGRTATRSPLELTLREEAGELESLVAQERRRRVETPLLAALGERLASSDGWVAVNGPAGSGKSVLCRQLVEDVRRREALPASEPDGTRWVVLYHAALPGSGFDPSHVARSFNDQLVAAGVRLPRERGVETLLSVERDEAAAFWSRLFAHSDNDDLRVLVVLDGLDEMQVDTKGRGLELLPSVEDAAVAKRARVVVGYRSDVELRPELRLAVQEQTGVLDLAAFYRGPEGAATLEKYLRDRHRNLPLDEILDGGGRRLWEEILERAERRFLWVFHLARGLQVDFLDQGTPGATWPTDEAFYSRYLAWLEERAARHPGYVSTLRRVLLTLALSPIPVNDRTLLWLFGVGSNAAPESDVALFRAWIRPVLGDLDDFLLRYQVDPHTTEPGTDDRAAALVVWRDAERVPSDGMVRRIAHGTLRAYLRGPDLDVAWIAARGSTSGHLAERMRDGLGVLTRESSESVPARLRYVQRCALPVIGLAEGSAAAAKTVKRFLEIAPLDYATISYAEHWIEGLRSACYAVPSNTLIEGVSPLAFLLRRMGSALAECEEMREAVKAHREEVRIWRALAAMPEGGDDETLRKACADRTDLLRELAIGLGGLGSALELCREGTAAVKAHREEVRIKRALSALPQDADDETLRKACAERTGLVCELAIALSRMGSALAECEEVREAVKAHREAVRMCRALAALPQDVDDETLRKACAERTDLVRDLAIALDCMGWALAHCREATEAVNAHREAIRIWRALAALPDGVDAFRQVSTKPDQLHAWETRGYGVRHRRRARRDPAGPTTARTAGPLLYRAGGDLTGGIRRVLVPHHRRHDWKSAVHRGPRDRTERRKGLLPRVSS